MDEVLDFINRRWKKDADWLDGNCYWFSKILCTRFPNLQIYYLPIEGHFVAGDDGKFYDWTGAVYVEEEPLLFSELAQVEPEWHNRIFRDCIR